MSRFLLSIAVMVLLFLVSSGVGSAAPNLVENGSFTCANTGCANNPFCCWTGNLGGRRRSISTIAFANCAAESACLHDHPLALCVSASGTGAAGVCKFSSGGQAELDVFQTVHGLQCGVPLTVHFHACEATVSSQFCGGASGYTYGCEQVSLGFGGQCVFEELCSFDGVTTGGICDVCFCVTPVRGCGFFSPCACCPNLLQGNVNFFEITSTLGCVNAPGGGTLGDSYAASAFLDPTISIAPKSEASGVPELNRPAAALPLMWVLVTLCTLMERRPSARKPHLDRLEAPVGA